MAGRGIGLGSIPVPRHRSQGSSESSSVRVGRVPVPPHTAHLSASNEPRGRGRGRSGAVAIASRSPGRETVQGQWPASSTDPALLAAHVNHGYSLLALGPGGGSPSGSCRGLCNKYPIYRRRSAPSDQGPKAPLEPGRHRIDGTQRPVRETLSKARRVMRAEGRLPTRSSSSITHQASAALRWTGTRRRVSQAGEALSLRPPSTAATPAFRQTRVAA